MPSRKRKYAGKTIEEIQEENKELTKANKELKYTIQSLEEFDELKDSLSKQNKTFGVLFDRGYID